MLSWLLVMERLSWKLSERRPIIKANLFGCHLAMIRVCSSDNDSLYSWQSDVANSSHRSNSTQLFRVAEIHISTCISLLFLNYLLKEICYHFNYVVFFISDGKKRRRKEAYRLSANETSPPLHLQYVFLVVSSLSIIWWIFLWGEKQKKHIKFGLFSHTREIL